MSLANKVLTSSSLLIGIKIFQRLVGLISILILARLLFPEDFAIVALVSIVVHFFDILSNAGSEQYIIQKSNVSEDDLNTAWTIDITMKMSLWLVLVLSSKWISDFFDQPELRLALVAASTILIINAVKNPGLFLQKQKLEYIHIFWLSVAQRLITFCVVILIAYIERSYWALIIGDITSSLIFTLGSYFIDPHRPKPKYKYWNKQWRFSGWLLLKSVIGYTRSQIDTLFVSKLFSTTQLGHYYMARDLAMTPSQNIIAPAIEPLLAAFSRSRNNHEELQYKVRFSLFVVSLITMPISFFFYFFPEPVIETLLGSKWNEAAPLLGILSLLLLYYSFVLVLEQCLLAMQKVRALFWYDAVSLILITTGLLLFFTETVFNLALGRGLLGILTMLALLFYLNSQINIKIFRLFLSVLPTLVASSGASCVTYFTTSSYDHSILVLLQNLAVFTLCYLAILAATFNFYKCKEYIHISTIITSLIKKTN